MTYLVTKPTKSKKQKYPAIFLETWLFFCVRVIRKNYSLKVELKSGHIIIMLLLLLQEPIQYQKHTFWIIFVKICVCMYAFKQYGVQYLLVVSVTWRIWWKILFLLAFAMMTVKVELISNFVEK